MKINKIKVQYLTIVMVLAAVMALAGTASTLPSFVASLKDYQVTAEYQSVDINITYKDKDKAFYERAAEQMMPMYPEFKFVAENDGLVFSVDDILHHEDVKFIITELKAMEPGVFWSVDRGCLGRACPQKINFKVVAKTLTINS